MAKNGDAPAEPAHRIAAVGGKTHEQICREIQERVNLLEVQEKVKKAAAADMALEALDSSEHIKATTFHNERYRH